MLIIRQRIQRRYCFIQSLFRNNLRHMFCKECTKKTSNVTAINISIGSNNDLIPFQICNIEIRTNTTTENLNQFAKSIIFQCSCKRLIKCIIYNTRQLKYCLILCITNCLNTACSRQSLSKDQFFISFRVSICQRSKLFDISIIDPGSSLLDINTFDTMSLQTNSCNLTKIIRNLLQYRLILNKILFESFTH